MPDPRAFQSELIRVFLPFISLSLIESNEPFYTVNS